MTKERIAAIKQHLEAAEVPNKLASFHMWSAAMLMWEEVDNGKSRSALGREIGKSHTHVRYMYNCWDVVGRKLGGKIEDLPPFNEVYHSTEVRGDPESAPESTERQRREAPDHTAHGQVMAAANALNALATNPAYWPLLDDGDWMILSELPAVIESILRDAGRLCAKWLSGRLVPIRLSCLVSLTA